MLLNNCSEGESRIKVNTTKGMWDAVDPVNQMMEKVHLAITERLELMNIYIESDKGKVYMNSTWPWKLLWAPFENEVNKLKM